MEIQVTVDDPKNYVRPITIKFNAELYPDTDLIESFCERKDRAHPQIAGRQLLTTSMLTTPATLVDWRASSSARALAASEGTVPFSVTT